MPSFGYWMLTSDMRLRSYGASNEIFDLSLESEPVAISSTKDGQGCLVLDSRGRVQAHGTARLLGDISNLNLQAVPVDIAASPSGVGYWIIDSDGSVFSFGNAAFLEGVPQVSQNAETAVSIHPTSTGDGYWISDKSGGVYSFGSAPFFGAVTAVPQATKVEIVGFASDPTECGYRLLSKAGTIFSFGGLPEYGSPSDFGGFDSVGLIASPDGFLCVDRRGAVTVHGSTPNLGSPVGQGLSVIAVT
ncbi:MAG: hypothetical protein ACJ05G_09105 [Actinomycetota bacterium]|nr:hypothetical protein [Acidimicrobiales bacterium]